MTTDQCYCADALTHYSAGKGWPYCLLDLGLCDPPPPHICTHVLSMPRSSPSTDACGLCSSPPFLHSSFSRSFSFCFLDFLLLCCWELAEGLFPPGSIPRLSGRGSAWAGGGLLEWAGPLWPSAACGSPDRCRRRKLCSRTLDFL